MEDNNKNENSAVVSDENSSDEVVQKGKPANTAPISAGVILAALIAGYALGYFPPKRVVAESPAPTVVAPTTTTPVPTATPVAPVQRAPAPSGGCGV